MNMGDREIQNESWWGRVNFDHVIRAWGEVPLPSVGWVQSSPTTIVNISALHRHQCHEEVVDCCETQWTDFYEFAAKTKTLKQPKLYSYR